MTTQKEKYFPPTCETVELRAKSVIAQSYGFENPFTEQDKW